MKNERKSNLHFKGRETVSMYEGRISAISVLRRDIILDVDGASEFPSTVIPIQPK